MGSPASASKTLRRKRKPLPTTVPVVDDVVVAVLTGGRPRLLRRTLSGLRDARVDKWDVVALVNGGDAPTLEVLKAFPWVRVEARPGPIRPIGPAVSELMELAQATGRRYTLHLEDDWSCTGSPDWIDRAAYALQDDRVGQVRLRSAKEKVMSVNMATGRRIRWAWAPDHAYSENAHLTFNPNLMRTADLKHVYPCRGEREAQEKFERLHRCVVQLIPGAFRHLGEDSLRRRLGRGHG